ncbi:MAG: sulfatase-like hydrolase/transferase [Planctomycetes bacterium]|nr:sulfatase-like hydrolase/transferase [Planctomycetota bacterium]
MPLPSDLPRRRDVLRAGAAFAALPWIAPGPLDALARVARDDDEAAPRLPSVLFVLSDSHRAETLGCSGDAQVKTPRFDAFAQDGLRLSSMLSNTPLCRPYRACLMSGMLGHVNGVLTNDTERNDAFDGRQWTPPDGIATLATLLDAGGYRCGYVGKWHLGNVAVDPGPMRLGFDADWAVGAKPVHDYAHWRYCTGAGKDDVVTGGGRFRPDMEADLALSVLERHRDADEPCFCVLSWGPPHDPLEPPPGFRRKPGSIDPPPNVVSAEARKYAHDALPGYYGLVEALDHSFGRLLDELDRRGLSDDTLVIYTSDHGNQMGSHDLLGKEMPYDGSTRVPFLARWKGRFAKGRVETSPCCAIDILPTLLGLVGLPVPAGLHGRDLSALLLDAPDATRRERVLLAGYETNVVPWPGWRGLHTGRHLYAERPDGPWMLFDGESDPWQMHDLLGDEPDLAKQMHEQLRAELAAVGDDWTTG